MIIGIDIDGVLAEFVTPFLKFHNERYDTDYRRELISNHKFWELWDISKEELINRLKEFNKAGYFKEIFPISGSQRGVKILSEKHELHIVTARPYTIYDETERWFKEHFPGIPFGVHFTNQWSNSNETKGKQDICLKLGVDLMIEDALEHVEECASHGIRVLLLDCPWNQTNDLPPNVTRVKSWEEILERVNSF